MNKYAGNLLKAAKGEVPDEIPVALFGGSPYNLSLSQVRSSDYYHDSDLKLQVFTKMFATFPEVVFLPGYWPDFGPVDIPSAFGSRVIWPENGSPHVESHFTSIDDVDKLKPINPYQSGLMPGVLKEWDYFWRYVDKKWVEEYGYLDGIGWASGPMETAALIRGYEAFLLDMVINPEKIHKLLEIVTDGILAYLRAQERINGKLKRLLIIDHVPSIVSREHFKEYFLPYTQRLFNEFHYADIKFWHNEGRCKHILDLIPDLGCNLWQFGDDDAAEAKETLKGKVTLMGKINPVAFLENNDEWVEQEAGNILKAAAGDKIFVLSTGGGLAPGTPSANIDAMVKVARNFK